MPATTGVVPGFNAPGVDFDQPFEMLEACHERVQRSLGLLGRLVEHVKTSGHDASSRSAAADVLRYFDIAAPLHHEDEEQHLFPALSENNDADMRDIVARLRADHVRLSALWARLRMILLTWRDSESAPVVSGADQALIDEFTQIYASHIPLEESLAYPRARSLFNEDRLAEIGREMAFRRRGR
ncbi:hemerythrin domain-containing protein [Ottowia thiooxydans]|uniref:hemerythrin domain-containing protein n=1 Tax=Ottowia thiooxydans TaxID=219182 RepID=UPI000423A7DD|nr:hemerythrin domain-containing protein [Ottowia thiooxydans]